MPSVTTSQPSLATDQAADLIHTLADFVKVCTLYPTNNERVQNSVRSILDKISALRGNRSHLSIRVLRDRFAVNEIVTVCDKPNAAWFAHCMSETAVSGLALSADVTSQSLLTFAEMLRDNVRAAKHAKTFQDLWSRTIPGLALSERLFGESAGDWGGLSPAARNLLESDTPRGAVLREIVENDGPFRELVDRFGSTDQGSGDGTVDSIELLRDLLELLPDSVVSDVTTCIDMIDRVLATNGEAVVETGRLSSDFAQLEFRRMILEVSSQYFAREDMELTDPTEDAAPKPTGHAGDEKFTDDVDAFAAEYAALPESELGSIEKDSGRTRTEQLGIALHQFLGANPTECGANLERVITDRLKEDGGQSMDLIRVYFEQLCSPTDTTQPWAQLDRLSGALERTGLMDYMNRFGIISPGVVAATFPQTFVPFLDALDRGKAANERLIELCQLIGPQRLLTMRPGDLSSAQRRRVYETKSRHILPFALAMMEATPGSIAREEFELLCGIDLRSPESAALRVLTDARLLPPQYVRDLCRFESGLGSDGDTLQAQSARMVRNYIELPPEGAPIERRVRAVRALRQFWSTSTEAFVLTLLGRSGLLRRHTYPAPIRDAAKELLRGMAKCQG